MASFDMGISSDKDGDSDSDDSLIGPFFERPINCDNSSAEFTTDEEDDTEDTETKPRKTIWEQFKTSLNTSSSDEELSDIPEEKGSNLKVEDCRQINAHSAVVERDGMQYPNQAGTVNWFDLSNKYHNNSKKLKGRKEYEIQLLLRNGLYLNERCLQRFQQKDDEENCPTYENSEEKLNGLLKKDPKSYKCCKIEYDESDLAVCRPLDACDPLQRIDIPGRNTSCQSYADDEVVVRIVNEPRARENKVKTVLGEVVGRLKRHRHSHKNSPVLVCSLDRTDGVCFASPLCKTVPKVFLLSQQDEGPQESGATSEVCIYTYNERGDLRFQRKKSIRGNERHTCVLFVVLLNWSRRHSFPRGAVIHCISKDTTLESSLKVLRMQYSIPSLYSNETTRHTSALVNNSDLQSVGPDELREDLTHLAVFTVDNQDVKDLEFALSTRELDNVTTEVGVHVSDVAFYLQKDDPLDLEAKQRFKSTFTVDGFSNHMLPEPLSMDMFSLLKGKTRRALSVIFSFGSDGKIDKGKALQMKRTFVKCRRNLTYTQVQDMINDSTDNVEETQRDVKRLYEIYKQLRTNRSGNAVHAVAFEDELHLGVPKGHTEAQQLVEEFRILVNAAVGEYLIPRCAIIYCQASPGKDDIKKWLHNQKVANTLISLQNQRVGAHILCIDQNVKQSGYVYVLKDVWDHLCEIDHEQASEVLHYLKTDMHHPLQSLVLEEWLQMQKPQEYRCSSCLSPAETYHFLLGYPRSTHFCSPIRRFPDIIVQRLVHSILDEKPSDYSQEEISNMCSTFNVVAKHVSSFYKECKVVELGHSLEMCPQTFCCVIEDVSEKGVVLHHPRLRCLDKSDRQLNFNVLDVRKRLDVKRDVNTAREFVTATWQKRLYDTKEFSSLVSARSTKYATKIDPYQDVQFIPVSKWSMILNHALRNKVVELKATVKNVDTETTRSRFPFCKGTTSDISTETHNYSFLKPSSKFNMTFTPGQVLKIQLTTKSQRTRLVPQPQLLHLTKNVQMCLQHASDPVRYLANETHLSAKARYGSVREYTDTFLPLVEMEAATQTLQLDECFRVNYVPCKFTGSTGKFYVGNHFCIKRNIQMHGGKMISLDKASGEKTCFASSGDWICIQYSQDTNDSQLYPQSKPANTWIAHGKIIYLKKNSRKDRVTVTFELHRSSPGVPFELDRRRDPVCCCVEVLIKAEVDRRTETCLRSIENSPLARKIATNGHFPPLEDKYLEIVEEIGVDNNEKIGKLPENNDAQQKAINIALTSRFSLIQGPPGTGKSYTGMKLIYLYARINRRLTELSKSGKKFQVLFCGPSNKSVDQIARWLRKRLEGECPNLVRVYGSSLEHLCYPMPGRYVSERGIRGQAPDKQLHDITLHNFIRLPGKPNAYEIRKMDQQFKRMKTVDPTLITKYKDLVNEACAEELKLHEVILCTTDAAPNPKILKGMNVLQLIVDEAGMCTEPRCIAPIIATNAKQVVLIGDHKQLQPIITCRKAAKLGLTKSLFERYAEDGNVEDISFTFMNIQYRMHPNLCSFPSEHFYGGKLETDPWRGLWKFVGKPNDRLLPFWPSMRNQTETMDPNAIYPHLFCHVDGEEKILTVNTIEGNEQSRSNQAEAEHVKTIYQYLTNVHRVDSWDINVISQYNAQCHLLKDLLEDYRMAPPNVNTVVASQGGEWNYVIFSLVRSLPQEKIEENPTKKWCHENLGFITDKHQINVALTRARRGLIIVGNMNLLRTDGEVWSKLLEEYQRRGCIRMVDEFPPPPPKFKLARRPKKHKGKHFWD